MAVIQVIQRNSAMAMKTGMVKKVIYCVMVRGSVERRRKFK
jgi:hypothetical protein